MRIMIIIIIIYKKISSKIKITSKIVDTSK